MVERRQARQEDVSFAQTQHAMEQRLAGKINQLNCIDEELEQAVGFRIGNSWKVFRRHVISFLADLVVEVPDALGSTIKIARLLQEREEVAGWIRCELKL